MSYSSDELRKMHSLFGSKASEIESEYPDHFVLEDMVYPLFDMDYDQPIEAEKYSLLLIPRSGLVTHNQTHDGSDQPVKYPLHVLQNMAEKEGKFIPSTPLMANITLKLFQDSTVNDGAGLMIIDDEKYQFVKGMIEQHSIITNSLLDYDVSRIFTYPAPNAMKRNLGITIDDKFNNYGNNENTVMLTGELIDYDRILSVNHEHVNPKQENFIRLMIGQEDPRAYRDMLNHFKINQRIGLLKTDDREGEKLITFGKNIRATDNLASCYRTLFVEAPGGEFYDI